MQKRRQVEREQATQEDIEVAPAVDLEETDHLLDEIDAILAEEEKRTFKEKLRSLSFMGRRARNPCDGVVQVPNPLVPLFRAIGARDAPPDCVDCE